MRQDKDYAAGPLRSRSPRSQWDARGSRQTSARRYRPERLSVLVPYACARSADMRYNGSVSNAFVQSMAHNFEQALRLMKAALTDCPDKL